ncbi:hypothetical protein ACFQS3_02665 [Glycomyces mayteni]|uniref:Tail assembly chaperone n=1 Tax=Glycomyces mayteni TaxID=543887 RepID=A0ABW2D3M0_9ACTN
MLHAYGDDIEADFHEYYRLDIADVYTGALSPAKAFRLMLRLPAASRFIRAVAGPKAEWNASEYILAGILDTLANANWQRGGGKGRRPKPIPRPGKEVVETRYGAKPTRSNAEVLKYLDSLK